MFAVGKEGESKVVVRCQFYYCQAGIVQYVFFHVSSLTVLLNVDFT